MVKDFTTIGVTYKLKYKLQTLKKHPRASFEEVIQELLDHKINQAIESKDLNTAPKDSVLDKASELNVVSADSWAVRGFLGFPAWDLQKG